MKLWQKIFTGTLIIFIVAFDAGTYFLASYAYNFNRQSERESGLREQEVILSSVADRIGDMELYFPDIREDPERLAAILRPLAEYYGRQNVYLALYMDDRLLYSNIPTVVDTALLKSDAPENKNITDKREDSKRFLYVSSRVPNTENLTLVYARDISHIDKFKQDIGRVFAVMNIVVLVFLGVAIYILLKRMTKPIIKLIGVTSEIADGAYNKRADENHADEIGKLAISFNCMADSVQEQMERLTKTAEERGRFIDDLSHEMKTPLTSILGYAQYLQNAKYTEEERITASGHLYDMTMRLKNLSDKLMELAFLRGEEIEMKPVSVSALFAALENTMRPLLALRDIHLHTQTDIAYIDGDETLLLSLLQNLIENAARASDEGGTVTVCAYNDKALVLEVSDTGCGIPAEELECITAPFYRADKSRSRKFGGAGLGLSIVSQIADLHGAELEIKSVSGKGTTIKVNFTTI